MQVTATGSIRIAYGLRCRTGFRDPPPSLTLGALIAWLKTNPKVPIDAVPRTAEV